MKLSSGLPALQQLRPLRSACDAPAWAQALVAGGAVDCTAGGGFHLTRLTRPKATLLRLELAAAAVLDPAELERRTVDAYSQIRRSLSRGPHPHPVRFWNFIPRIGQPMDAQRDRYMVFNAGRFAAFEGWFSAGRQFSSQLPAASAVGHAGDSLVIYGLSMGHPGVAIENPRQIPAFDYSVRYGPRPPCFSRATVVNAVDAPDRQPLLIVSGTASILGERTAHPADIDAQLDESLDNLRSLLAAAGAVHGDPMRELPLSAFESVRIYHRSPHHAGAIAAGAAAAFGAAVPVELVVADLCRADLLVEIEGIARLNPAPQPGSAS